MKLAIIGQKGIPSRAGGVEIHVEEIASRLACYGENVTVYCRESYCEEKYDKYKGINIKYIPSINTKHLDAITYTFLATIDAIKSKSDIIHYHALGPSLLSFIPRIFGKKVIVTSHGLDWKREKWGIAGRLALKLGEIASIKFPHKTISVSKSMVKYYKEKYKNTDIIYIPNGIDEKKNLVPNKIKEKFNLEKDQYILFLARLVPEKGAHYLIDAFKNLETSKKLVIAGGSSHSDDYVNELKEKAKDNPNIIFTGFVTGDLVDELFTNAYLYVLPSEIEGLPISLLEAMSYGQACLVSDIEENLEVVEKNAMYFKSKDTSDLEKQLKTLISNKELVNNYKAASKDFILKKYNWDDVAIKTREVLNSLVSKKIDSN